MRKKKTNANTYEIYKYFSVEFTIHKYFLKSVTHISETFLISNQ